LYKRFILTWTCFAKKEYLLHHESDVTQLVLIFKKPIYVYGSKSRVGDYGLF